MKNYLFDLYPGFPNGFNLADRKDPDSCSKALYDDLETTFFNSSKLKELGIHSAYNKEQGKLKKYYTLFVNGDDILLSSDYIGPSVHWAQKAKLTDDEITSFLAISRTLGGHIVFPRGAVKHNYKNEYGKWNPVTMNWARGGQYGYYDRFDKTLYSIKRLFNGEEILNEWVKKAWVNYSDWFDLFRNHNEPFKFFVEYFCLRSFVNDDYEVYDLTSYDKVKGIYEKTIIDDISVIPTEIEGYRKYVQGSINAISSRNTNLGL